MALSLRAKIFMGFAAPIVLLVVTSVFQYRALLASASTTSRVAHTSQVLASANALARIAMAATSANRGYLLTRESAFLDSYDAAVREFGPVAAELRQLLSGQSAQVERVDYLIQLFIRWRTDIAERNLRVPEGKQPSGASEREANLAGTALVNEVTQELDELILAERGVLHERTVAHEATISNAGRLSVLAPSIATVLALVIALLLSRDLGGAIGEVGDAARELASGDFDRRVAVKRRDEIGALATAFNTMADHLVERTREASLLNRLGESLEACLTMEEATAAFSRSARPVFNSLQGGFYMINASRDLVAKVFHWGEGKPIDNFDLEGCWALRRGRPHYVEDLATGCACAHVERAEGVSSICIPLSAHGESHGILQLAATAGELHEGRRRMVQAMAEHFALAVANLQLRDKLRGQSIRDGLTGVFNRRYIDETIGRELGRAERTGEPVGVLMFDVDHFKRYNDTFGHDAGDAVLRHIGGLLRASFRQGDATARFGGEEFMVLCPGADLAQLLRRAERLRQAVKDLSITLRGTTLGQVTISIGAAVYPHHGTSRDALFNAADQALYRAKREGRDRVIVADSLPPAGPFSSGRPAAPAATVASPGEDGPSAECLS